VLQLLVCGWVCCLLRYRWVVSQWTVPLLRHTYAGYANSSNAILYMRTGGIYYINGRRLSVTDCAPYMGALAAAGWVGSARGETRYGCKWA